MMTAPRWVDDREIAAQRRDSALEHDPGAGAMKYLTTAVGNGPPRMYSKESVAKLVEELDPASSVEILLRNVLMLNAEAWAGRGRTPSELHAAIEGNAMRALDRETLHRRKP